MSEKVNQLIDTIRAKAIRSKELLLEEKLKTEQLANEIARLKAELMDQNNMVADLELKITGLNADLNKAVLKSASVDSENKISNEEIDELVNEIEYCIKQLKK
jgi:ABC-type transporter Mla subunit MlaD